MSRALLLLFVNFGVLFQSTASVLAAEPPVGVDIRDPDGNVLIAADQIRAYDWATHTFTLDCGVRGKLQAKFYGDIKREDRKSLVSGIPFTLCVDGKPIYDGKFTASLSSFSFDAPVILVDFVVKELMEGEDELRIQLGYPNEKFFKGQDRRADQRIHDALRSSGKLVNVREDRIQWVTAALQEMQSIKPGMTRGELKKVFSEEGGLSNRLQRRYVYRDCPYIKVDVKFEAVEAPEDKLDEQATDKVKDISRPFLEWSIGD